MIGTNIILKLHKIFFNLAECFYHCCVSFKCNGHNSVNTTSERNVDEWNKDWDCTKDRKILDRSEVGGTSVDKVCK